MKARAGRPQSSTRMIGPGPRVVWGMVAGGVLWMVHGYFRFIMPYGPDAIWREDLGYSPIFSTERFLLYNAPGVLALLLTAVATFLYLRRLSSSRRGLHRAAQILAMLAILFGLIAAVGVFIRFVPPTTGGVSMGVPALGLALVLAGLALGRDGMHGEGQTSLLVLLLVLTGLVGMFTLPVQPLMYALAVLPPTVGTAVFVVFGVGWAGLHSSSAAWLAGLRGSEAKGDYVS